MIKVHYYYIFNLSCYGISTEYELELNLRYLRIYFDTTSIMKITKYKSTTFEDKLSAVGGTMGLLTGFSIISAVELAYFGVKIIFNRLRTLILNL